MADQFVRTRGIGGDFGSTAVRPRLSVPGRGSGAGSEHHAVPVDHVPETLELSKSLVYRESPFTRVGFPVDSDLGPARAHHHLNGKSIPYPRQVSLNSRWVLQQVVWVVHEADQSATVRVLAVEPEVDC